MRHRIDALIDAASPRRRALFALALGAFSALAMPPLGAVPVYLLTVPGLILLLRAASSARRAFALGWCFGFGFHLIGLYWISFALFTDIGQFWWALPFSAAGLPVLLGVFSGLAGLTFHLLRPGGLRVPFAFAAAWTAAELLRGWVFTGFPWNLPAYAWVHVPPVWQGLALGGAYGLSFFTVLLAALPVLLLTGEVAKRRVAAALSVGAALSAALAGWGGLRLAAAPTEPVPGVRLRLVQPNIPQSLKWAPGQRRANFLNHLELTELPADRPPTVAVWAETAAPFFVEREPQARSMMVAALPDGTRSLLVGSPAPGPAPGPADEPGGPRLFHNALTALDRDGNVTAQYFKHHLVPFGEYMPLRRFLPVGAIAGDGGEYAPGPGPRTLTVPGAPPFSPLICYEAIFPGAAVDDADRPQWLLNLTNDAWYGLTAGPYQHLTISAARAVEEGLPLVRVANTGISAVVDSYGRVVAALPLGTRGALDVDLPRPAAEPTAYSRMRDAPLVALIILTLAICASNRIFRN